MFQFSERTGQSVTVTVCPFFLVSPVCLVCPVCPDDHGDLDDHVDHVYQKTLSYGRKMEINQMTPNSLTAKQCNRQTVYQEVI